MLKTEQVPLFGSTLVDSISLSDSRQDFLFAALILTAIGVFIGGNLLLLNREVMAYSAPIAAVCLAILFVFYSLSRILQSLIWGLVLTYGLLWALVYANIPGMHIAFYGLGGAAFLYTVFHIRVERTQWLSIILMAVIGTAVILGVKSAATSFDILPRLHSGMVHQDTLFHSSIAAMFKNYGVVSTGLHGVVETPYHAFSHMLIAGISLSAGVGVLETYGVAPWVLFAPLLIFAITALCAALDRNEQLSLLLIWGISSLLLTLLPRLLSPWALWDSFWTSESNLVSLGLFLLAFALFFKRDLSILDVPLIFLVAVLIANAKASIGLIFVGLWMVRLLLISGDSRRLDFAVFVSLAAAVGWSVIDAAGASSGGMSIKPLSFVTSFSMWGVYLGEAGSALLRSEIPSLGTLALAIAALIGFIVFHFMVTWVVFLHTGYRLGLNKLLRTPIAIYSLAAVAAGLAIVLIFDIPGGSAYYFTHVATFVSLPAFAAMLAVFFQRKGFDERFLLGSGIAFIVVVSLSVYKNLGGAYDYRYLPLFYSGQTESPMISHLLKLRDSPPNIVFQPSAELLADNPVKRCTAQPFVFPAVSERAWVDVVQGDGDCNYLHYGYAQYGLNPGDQRVKMKPKLLPEMLIELHAK